MLSYFGTDQSQVQRYISGSSLKESRLGLMFNAVCKIPMQFSILFIGVLLFVFYQFEKPPLFFDSASRAYMARKDADPKLLAYKSEFDNSHTDKRRHLEEWLRAKRSGDRPVAKTAFAAALAEEQRSEQIRDAAGKELASKNLEAKAHDADYVFITFILSQLPHGIIGLLVAAFLPRHCLRRQRN